MKKVVMIGIVSASVMLLSSGVFAQAKERVRFAAGTHGSTLRGTVRGYAFRDYIVRASGGQTIHLKLDASVGATVFTVLLPNGDNLSGAAEANDFSGELPDTGDYVVRVMMMRSAARRKGSVSNFTLRLSIR